MKILFLSHRLPYPPNKGDKLRAFNILRHLSQKHQIDLGCLVDNQQDLGYVADLKPYCRHIRAVYLSPFKSKLYYLRQLFSNHPLTLAHFYSAHFRKRIPHWIAEGKYDLLYVYSAAMSQYVLDIDHPPKLLDLVDADCQKWLSYAQYASPPLSSIYRLEGRRTRKYETLISSRFATCTVVSEAEKQILGEFLPPEKLQVVANGIDQRPYQPYLGGQKPEGQKLIFIGGMFYFAYIDGILHFYKHSFDLIRKAFPKLEFYIIGANPARKIRKLAQDPNIRVTGYVEDVIPYLKQASVYVVPLRMAPGIQNKILEAMVMKVPIVSTSAAIAGIDAQPGRDILVADEPQAFAESVIKLLREPQYGQELAQNASRLIAEKYDWQKNLRVLDQILEGIT